MPRKTKTAEEAGFMRSFWDECRTLQADYTAAVGMFSIPTGQPGVWQFRITFTPLLEDHENWVGTHSVAVLFPNATTQTLAFALWDASRKLADQVAKHVELYRPRPPKKG